MNLKSIFSITFCLLLATPSVFSQRKNRNCTQTVSLDLGGHRVFIDGPIGANVGISLENTISQHFSWITSFTDFFNKADVAKYYAPQERVIEHRIAIKGGINYYPIASLYGFYIGLSGGGMIHTNAVSTSRPFGFQSGTSIKKLLTTNFGLIYDLKLGCQFVTDSKFTITPYLGMGLFHPMTSNLNFLTTEPYFQLGFRLGRSVS